MIVYLHGFNSSPDSVKARQLQNILEQTGQGNQFCCPSLPFDPEQSIKKLGMLLDEIENVTLVGSSLGGYFATWLAEQRNLRAILINPVVSPATRFKPLLGLQQNLYNGEKWVLTQSHLDALLKIDTPVTRLRNYLLLLETGDEILDWQDAARHYHGAEQKIFPGGNHAFTRFQACLPQILAFAGLASSANIPCNPID